MRTFEPTAPKTFVKDGDFAVRDHLDKPLLISVVESREGVKTPYNQDPSSKSYAPDGQTVVNIDVAVIATDTVYIHAGLFQPALVDQLRPYVGANLPVKFVSTKGKSGYSYFQVEPLTGTELAAASKWAEKNSTRFADRRAELEAEAGIENNSAGPDVNDLLAQLAAAQGK